LVRRPTATNSGVLSDNSDEPQWLLTAGDLSFRLQH
jgi:hypothetical protein